MNRTMEARAGAGVWLGRLGRRRLTNAAMLAAAGAMTLLAVVPLLWILVYVAIRGAKRLSPSLVTELPRPMGVVGGGVLHSIEGTGILLLIAAALAVPVGVLVGVSAAQRGGTLLGTLLRFGTDVLSGVPSIVIGLFCYAVVVKVQGRFSALAGGISLAVIMLPLFIRTTEEMVKLVPQSLSEASLALGAPKWKTWLTVVLPAALSGVLTGTMLAVARAAGETAPLLFTALGNDRYEIGAGVAAALRGGRGLSGVLDQVFGQPVDALPLTLWKYSQQPYAERVEMSWAIALVLVALVLGLNVIARLWIGRRRPQLIG